jgi:hypothetical protein
VNSLRAAQRRQLAAAVLLPRSRRERRAHRPAAASHLELEQNDGAEPQRVRLVVALGNLGSTPTRATTSAWTVNRRARRHGIKLSGGGQAAIGEGTIRGQTVTLAKPRTYVNLAARRYGT